MISRLCNQKSPSFLKDVIQGRRNLTTEHMQKLSKYMNLDERGCCYFSDLVILEDSKSVEQQQAALIRINSVRRVQGATPIE